MSDKPTTSPDAAWAAVLRNRRDDLLHDRELLEERLAEVNEMLRLVETPAAATRQRRPRQQVVRDTTATTAPAPVVDFGEGVA